MTIASSSAAAGPWRRLLRDRDALETLVVAGALLAVTAGLALVPSLRRVWRAARHTPARIVDARRVLLFGKRLDAGAVHDDLHRRVARAEQLLRESPEIEVMLLGGRSGGGPSEAEVAHALLVARDAAHAPRLRLEAGSVDTLTNLRNARALLAGLPPAPVALLSSRYHLARCAMLAQRLGYAFELCAAEDELRLDARELGRLLHEAALLYWIEVGARWARLTGNRRMLDRVS